MRLMAMDAERTIKTLFAPLTWSVLTIIWFLWLLAYLIVAPRHLKEVWHDYTESLSRVLED
jgi:hypothetical protein